MQNFIFKKRSLLLLFSTLFMISSCGEKDPLPEVVPKQKTETETDPVNEWIKDYMDVVYLWNTRIPAETDKMLYPADYFESLLYKTEDHFSYIAEDYAQLSDLLVGVQIEAGYDFSLFRASAANEDVLGLINYIKPDSPASSTDLQRGDIFLTINGKQLTLSNYRQLLEEISAPHVLGIVRNNAIQSFSLTVTRYEENPVLLDTIYEMGGKKIAYMIFNFFAVDKGDNSYAYLKKLNEIFGKYKETPVDELILDLRYNGGGQVTVATALASMISNRGSSDVFSIDQYNSIVDEEFKRVYGNNYNITFFDDYLMIWDEKGRLIEQIPVNKLTGIDHLYVLTSFRTASSSELVINSLKPYMDVVLIGETTYGKNVGMWLIYEEDQEDNRWGMLPVVVKTYNSAHQSDYTTGFEADILVDEFAVMPLLPLGNTRDPLLEAALDRIGVQAANPMRSAERRFDSQALMSSIDRTPVRNNMIKKQIIPR